MPVASPRKRWNARHAARTEREQPPCDWLVAQRDLLEPLARGRALDVAAGRGRHAFHLASLGFVVDAVDVSDVAVDTIERRRRREGATVRAYRAELPASAFPLPAYDVVLVVDFLERALFPRLEAAVAPGGVRIYEAFTRDHAGMRAEFALRPNELLHAFPALRVLRYRDTGPRAGVVARRA